jgi:Helix-hairpin-helix motif
MKRNRHKEECPFHETDAKGLKKNASENILIFLFLAAILLALNVFHSNRSFLQQKFLPLTDRSLAKKFVWLSGSSDLAEGLYQFSPEQPQNRIAEIYFLLSGKSGQNTLSPISAIDLGGDTPEKTVLPPRVANIFFQPIPINRAGENILTSLPGIGPALAERIIQRRALHGPFRSKEELMLVKGIGPKKYAGLTEHITIY